MPELPDVELYLARLRPRLEGRRLDRIVVKSPFLLRSVDPPLDAFEGRPVRALSRLGKRIVWSFDDELYLVIHLMIAGRFRWGPPGQDPPGKVGSAAFRFENGTLSLTEAGSKKRASLHAARGDAGLARHDRGGIEVLDADLETFRARLLSENRTLKRALTDPRLFSGIGNAYSDEILHAARLSPVRWTSRLDDDAIVRLHDAVRSTLGTWVERLLADRPDRFPTRVTAFRPEMAVHGKYREPCPRCGDPVQRIRYADNESNYCATCQTDGRLLADRGLSRLLRGDWPRTLDELENRIERAGRGGAEGRDPKRPDGDEGGSGR